MCDRRLVETRRDGTAGRLILVVLALSTVTSAHAQRWVRLAREADCERLTPGSPWRGTTRSTVALNNLTVIFGDFLAIFDV